MPKHSNREEALVYLARESLAGIFGAIDLRLRQSSKRRAGSGALESGNEFDFELDLSTPEGLRHLLVEVKSAVPQKALPQLKRRFHKVSSDQEDLIPILFVPRVTPRVRQELRDARINYADLSGAASIRAPGMWVELAGGEVQTDWRPAPGSVNPFSDKASLVLRVLLRDVKRSWKVTEIARSAKVTKGWVSIVARALDNAKYIERSADGLRLIEPVRILRDWTVAYSWNRNRIWSYHAGFEANELLTKLGDMVSRTHTQCALTLLAGSTLVAPHVEHEQLHVYVAPKGLEEFRERARRDFFLEPVTTGGNFHLVKPYYATSAFYEAQEIERLPVVSPLQLYLDLYAFPLRGREAADVVLRTRLAKSLNLSQRELASLL